MSQEIQNYDIDYTGWGPCVHTPEEQRAFIEWFNEVLPFEDREVVNPWQGGPIDNMIWFLNMMGGCNVELVCDQWTAVCTTGKIGTKIVRTFIEGDTFLISVTETYRWWREKYKEIMGKDYKED